MRLLSRFFALLGAFAWLASAPVQAQTQTALMGCCAMGPAVASGGGGGSFTTLDPSNKGGGVSVGAGNLIYTTSTPGGAIVRSLASMTSGLHKFEITFNGSTAPQGTFGVCDSNLPLSGSYMGQAHGFGFGANGQVGVGVTTSGDPALTAGETIAVEFNAGTGDLYYVTSRSKYGPYNISSSAAAPPASPFLFCAESDIANGSASWTFNFGSSAWVRTTTAGYSGL